MFEVDIRNYIPRFLLNDKNGYALSKAIEAGMQYFNDKLLESVNLMVDVSTMPEWRLDEIAWELGALYDNFADIETKRKWIQEAFIMSKYHGTPYAMKKFLEGYFDNVKIIELINFQFRIEVDGTYTPETARIVNQAVELSKNVRSTFNGFTISSEAAVAIDIEGESESTSVLDELILDEGFIY